MRKVSLAQSVFFNLVKNCNEEQAIDYIKNDAKLLEAKDENGYSVLEVAIIYKCNILKNWLLNDNYKPTIFEYAALGNNEILNNLISTNPKELESVNDKGCSLIHIATYFGHTDLALSLIEKGADIFYKNKNNQSALDIAMQKSDINMIEILLNVNS